MSKVLFFKEHSIYGTITKQGKEFYEGVEKNLPVGLGLLFGLDLKVFFVEGDIDNFLRI